MSVWNPSGKLESSMSASQRYFRPGQNLFKEGDPSRAMYVVQKGTVSVRKMKGGGYVELGRIHANEVLGELSFFDRLPRSATAIALNEVEVIEIDFVSLDKIYKGIPNYFKTIFACVAERLRKSNETVRRLHRHIISDKDGVVAAEKEAEAAQEVSDADTEAMLEKLEADEKSPQGAAEDNAPVAAKAEEKPVEGPKVVKKKVG